MTTTRYISTSFKSGYRLPKNLSEIRVTSTCPIRALDTITMAASPPRSSAVDAELPCMPRRQSCDRCHEQKVRCVTVEAAGSEASGDIAEEATQNPGGHFISSVPCARCRKAGAVCIYSPQLRSGRPRRRQDSRAAPPRRRGRRASRSPSSSSAASPEYGRPSPAPLPHQTSALPESPGGIPLSIAHHPSQEFAQDPGARETASLPCSTVASSWHQNVHRNPDTDTPPLTEQWHRPSSYHTSGAPTTPADTCGLAAFAAVPAIPCASVFPQPANDMIPTADHDFVGGYSWSLPSSSESLLEELSQINLRIHLGGRSLPEPSTTTAPWSLAAVNDVLDAACSLTDAVDRFTAGRAMSSREPQESGRRRSSALDAAFDSSTRLTLHACHQALLGVFDHISAWLLLYLAQSPQQRTPPATPPHLPAYYLATCNQQAAVMANLMGHLLNELDRTFLASSMLMSTKATPGPPVALGRGMSNPGGPWEPPDLHSGHAAWRGGNTAVFFALSHDVEHRERHARVRERLGQAEELLGLRQRNVRLRQ
ncbi:hypothetical protein L209DRAFT_774652 [Thermothelomyces heterothallicus CBS 203.75]